LKKLQVLVPLLEGALKTPATTTKAQLEPYYAASADAYTKKAWEIANKVVKDSKGYADRAKEKLEKTTPPRTVLTAKSELKTAMDNVEAYNLVVAGLDTIAKVDAVKEL